MKSIAIITARGGSKRIPRKNIKDFNGKPLISYSIKAALESELFEEVLVSTDDEEIAKVATLLGAEVPFMRSDENSNDFATTSDVLDEVFRMLNESNKKYKYFCCIYPTAPFLTGKKLVDSYNLLSSGGANTVFSMCRFSSPIQRAFRKRGDYVEMIYPENYSIRSQDLEASFYDAGQFYWGDVNIFLSNKKLFSEKSIGFELSELEVQDIDTLSDWELAELKYQQMINKK